MTAVELTPEQRAQARELADEHASLQHQLLEMNRELDELLSRRGQGLSRVQPFATRGLGGGGHSQADKLAARNEQQRRINEDLTAQLLIVDTIAKTDDLKQRVAGLTQQCEALRDENRALENVFAHQHVETAAADRAEEEIKRARAEHSEELHRLRDVTRQLKEARDQATTEYRQLQRQETRAETKLRVQETGTLPLEELQAAVAERDATTASLRAQIVALSKASGDRQRARARNDRVQREYDELLAEATRLREQTAEL